MYDPHITLVRNEIPELLENWDKYSGKEISFLYSNLIHNDEKYWWLNCFSKKLERIRLELGLPVSSPYTLPPSGFYQCFHSTLANNKV
jgi:hypothetical protein